jgi:transposase
MRGTDQMSETLFSYIDLESRVPQRHPLRLIRGIENDVLVDISVEFEAMYAATGRPSIPPEQLLRTLLLQAFYSIRSERQLMEQLDFNLLFRWFVGLGLDDRVWDASTFCYNRDRLLEADVSTLFLKGVIAHKKVQHLLSRDHFSVDGTLIATWASMKSFRAKDDGDLGGNDGLGRNRERDFRGETRSNETHASRSDDDACLYRKGKGMESRLCYLGHALMENRNGLVVDALFTRATGTAERDAAWLMALRRKNRDHEITLGADKAYDTRAFVADCTVMGVTPHVARNTSGRRSAIPETVAKTEGYARSHSFANASRRCSAG